MPLTDFRANVDFSQWSFQHFGNAEVSREADNLGTAMHCLSPEAEAEGRVQRRRNLKEHWRPLLKAGENLP
jgi:hypothetical protein